MYEGTTAIQAQDFFFRQDRTQPRVALQALSAEIGAFLASIEDQGSAQEEREAVQRALDSFGGMVAAMVSQSLAAKEDIRKSTRSVRTPRGYYWPPGDLMVGYLLVRQAVVALTALDREDSSSADRAFYGGESRRRALLHPDCASRICGQARRGRVDGQRVDGRRGRGVLIASALLWRSPVSR